MSNLPTDPMILLSYINTKLRDEYESLNAMCEDLQLDEEAITSKLSTIDYHYDSNLNRFA
ncbi:MAG: DUF4250 domain-containing protein [Lachnospiraceae bacterium]|nr:DUF4250 domain-containing protein [Lachnospiraceae bacterium]